MGSIQYEQSLTVERPRAFVFAYLADHSHASDWSPSVLQSTKTTPGPVRVGTHFDLQLKRAGLSLHGLESLGLSELALDTTLSVMDEPQYIELKGKSETFSLIQRFRLEEVDDGHTHIQAQFEVYFHEPRTPLLGLFGPWVKSGFREDLASLGRTLNQKPSQWRPSLGSRIADRLVLPGMVRFTRRGFAESKDQWSGVTTDMRGKTVAITGPTSGIGAATAKELAKRGAQLLFICRNAKRAEQFADALEAEGYLRPRIEIADVSLAGTLDALCTKLVEEGEPIHVLINNAGSLFRQRVVSPEGLELSFATLLLGPYTLCTRLYPLLKKAGDARVINVSSGGMYTQAVALDDLEFEKEDYSGSRAYARAKRGLVDISELLADRWKADGITVHAMHPGWTDTPGVATALPRFYSITKPWLRSADQGADTVVWLAAAPEASETSGLFWLDRTPHGTSMLPGTRSTRRRQELLAEKLEEYVQRLTSARAAGSEAAPAAEH